MRVGSHEGRTTGGQTELSYGLAALLSGRLVGVNDPGELYADTVGVGLQLRLAGHASRVNVDPERMASQQETYVAQANLLLVAESATAVLAELRSEVLDNTPGDFFDRGHR